MGIPVYVGKKFEASHEGAYEVEFACRNCGYECDVAVRAKGHGSGHSPFFGDDGGALDEAVAKAQWASARNARATARLLACPRCGQRSKAAILGFVFFSLLKLALVSAPCVLFGAYFLSGRYYRGFGWLMVAVGAICAISIYFTSIHPRYFRAGQRSRFIRAEPR
ncbi:MAG: hypothetical protein JXR96_07775 [Deltaproteobacteria bacterium]|nr:hypothetical protein [Deltaproteobacteria bacterium]